MLHKILKSVLTVLFLGLISTASYSKDLDKADVAIRSILGLTTQSGAVVLKEECLVQYNAEKSAGAVSSIYIKVRSFKDAQKVFSFSVGDYRSSLTIFDNGSVDASYEVGDDCETQGCNYYYDLHFKISKDHLSIEDIFDHTVSQLNCKI